MLAHPTQRRTDEWTHIGVEAGNAGTDSIVAPSRDMGGVVSAVLSWENTLHPPQPRLGSEHPTPCRDWGQQPYPTPTGRLAPYPTQTGSGPHLALPPNFRDNFPRGLSSSSCTR